MIFEALKRWARTHTDRRRYSPVGVAFHWGIAGLILFQLWWGWRISRLPVGVTKVEAYELHSQLGLLILVVTLLRIGWRFMVPGPINDADKPGWQSGASKAVHLVFYGCLIGLPLSGWAMMSSTARQTDLSVAGLAPWPHLPLSGLSETQLWTIEAVAENIHFGLVLALLVLIPLHIGATLKHEFIDQDDVLKGMLPYVPRLRRLFRAGWRRIQQPRGPRAEKDAC